MAWIYLKDLEASIQEADGFLCEAQFARLLHRLNKNRTFYKRVFSEQSQNTLSQYVYQYNVKKAEEMLKKVFGEQILDEKMRFLIRYHASAWVSCMIQFVTGRLTLTPEALAAHIYSSMPPPLSHAMRGELLFDS